MRFLRRFRRNRSNLSSDANMSARPAAILTGASDQALEKSGKRFGFSETVCGWAVAIGVVLEYGPKLITFIHTPNWFTVRDLSGGALIALGVAGEVLFASLADKKRDQLRDRNVKRVAELNLEAEKERAARVQVEKRLIRWTVRRTLEREEIQALQDKLRRFSGQRLGLTVAATRAADAATMEPDFFAMQIRGVFQEAGWIEETMPPTLRVGKGMLIECNDEEMGTAMALSLNLRA